MQNITGRPEGVEKGAGASRSNAAALTSSATRDDAAAVFSWNTLQFCHGSSAAPRSPLYKAGKRGAAWCSELSPLPRGVRIPTHLCARPMVSSPGKVFGRREKWTGELRGQRRAQVRQTETVGKDEHEGAQVVPKTCKKFCLRSSRNGVSAADTGVRLQSPQREAPSVPQATWSWWGSSERDTGQPFQRPHLCIQSHLALLSPCRDTLAFRKPAKPCARRPAGTLGCGSSTPGMPKA